MPRGRKPRTWVKLDCEGILRGSINYLLSLDGQAIWVKMIAYSEMCGGRPGFIEDNNNKGLPFEFIAQELHCPLEAFELVIKKMREDGAVKVNGTGSIQLVNFKHYQFSEYERQKPYRLKTNEGAQTFDEYVEAIRKDYIELDIEKELQKFKLWWSESPKELKRPKSAFRNWLDKARQFKLEGAGNGKIGESGRSAGNAHCRTKRGYKISGQCSSKIASRNRRRKSSHRVFHIPWPDGSGENGTGESSFRIFVQ